MAPEERKRTLTQELWIASTLIVAGLLISGVSIADLEAHNLRQMAQDHFVQQQLAQGTPPLQSSPPVENTTPAEAKPGGSRPTTPAPEPARPDPEAQKDGAKPALPPAPAEKVAPPIKNQ
jgi:hypothetical protein